MGTRREAKIKSGEELKSALCTACGTQSPANFSNVTLNTLLDFAKLQDRSDRGSADGEYTFFHTEQR